MKEAKIKVKVVQDNKNSFKGLFSSIAGGLTIVNLATKAFNLLKNVVVDAFHIFTRYHKANSKLAAILQTNTKNIKDLTAESQRLGRTTKYTARQVAELQTEFAKLGYTKDEIKEVTEATLSLAAATDTSLSRAAEVVGSTVRGFGLLASETSRVSDVMAKSFSSSALDMENFAESMKLVAPIAKAANVNIEATTAALGQLHNSGLKGSVAGTALKNIMIKMSDSSSKLSKTLGYTVHSSKDFIRALKDLKKKNIDVSKALELTDKRSAAAFLTMVNGADDVDKLKESLDNAEGSAKKMSDTMQDNLLGDITKAGSAWEGFVNSVTKKGGALDLYLREVTQRFTKILNVITALFEGEKGLFNYAFGDMIAKGTKNSIDDIEKRVKDALSKASKDIQNDVIKTANFKIKEYEKLYTSQVALYKKKIKEQQEIMNNSQKGTTEWKDAYNLLQVYGAIAKATEKYIISQKKLLKKQIVDEKQLRIQAEINAESERIKNNKKIAEKARKMSLQDLEAEIKMKKIKLKEELDDKKKYSDEYVSISNSGNREIETLEVELYKKKSATSKKTIKMKEAEIAEIHRKYKELNDILFEENDKLIIKEGDTRIKNMRQNLEKELSLREENSNEYVTIALKGYYKIEQAEIALAKARARIEGWSKQELENRINEIVKTYEDAIDKLSNGQNINITENMFMLSDDEKKRIQQSTIQFAGDLANIILDTKQQQIQNELDLENYKLEKQKENELKNKNLTEEQKAMIEEKYKKKRSDLEKKAFEEQKRNDIARTMINTAIAIMNVWATAGNPYVAAVESAFVASLGGIEVNQIKKQKYVPTYAKGGLLEGPSHLEGGIKTRFGELEGNEFVVNRKDTARMLPVLENINSGKDVIDYNRLASLINDKKVIISSVDMANQIDKDIDIRNQSLLN